MRPEVKRRAMVGWVCVILAGAVACVVLAWPKLLRAVYSPRTMTVMTEASGQRVYLLTLRNEGLPVVRAILANSDEDELRSLWGRVEYVFRTELPGVERLDPSPNLLEAVDGDHRAIYTIFFRPKPD